MQPQDIRLLTCNFRLDKNISDSNSLSGDISISLASEVNHELNQLTCFLKAELKDPAAPFHFQVEFGGKFELSPDELEDPKTLEQLKNVNCPAIIFPYLRETVSTLVNKANLPPFYLPAVNFIDRCQSKDAVSSK